MLGICVFQRFKRIFPALRFPEIPSNSRVDRMVYLSQGLHKADQAKGVAVLGVLDILPAIIGGPFFTAVFPTHSSLTLGSTTPYRISTIKFDIRKMIAVIRVTPIRTE